MGISKNYVNLIENGRKQPGDRLLADICREFGIDEHWLRTGEGEPKRNTNMDFGNICAEIGIKDEKAKEAIIKYYALSNEDKELWWRYMDRFMK